MPASKRRRSRSARRRAAASRPLAEGQTASAQAVGNGRSGARSEGSRTPEAPARRRGPERPRAPWHPLPLAEVLIVAGAGALLFALANGPGHSLPALFAGLGALLIGTLDVTVREHFSGYRSHALLLALLPVVVLHTVLVLLLSSFTSFPRAANLALLALDLAIASVLFRYLRARYVEARRRALIARR